MSLRISGHHLEVTPAIQGYVSDKFARISRHFDQVSDIKVLLSIENEKEKERRQKAECSIHVKGHDFFAETVHSDLYAAVDLLVDKMDHQVAKHKTKVQNHHHVAAKRLIDAEAWSNTIWDVNTSHALTEKIVPLLLTPDALATPSLEDAKTVAGYMPLVLEGETLLRPHRFMTTVAVWCRI